MFCNGQAVDSLEMLEKKEKVLQKKIALEIEKARDPSRDGR